MAVSAAAALVAELQGRAGDLETEVRVSRQQAQEGQEKLLHMKAACEEHELTISSMRALTDSVRRMRRETHRSDRLERGLVLLYLRELAAIPVHVVSSRT